MHISGVDTVTLCTLLLTLPVVDESAEVTPLLEEEPSTGLTHGESTLEWELKRRDLTRARGQALSSDTWCRWLPLLTLVAKSTVGGRFC